MTSSKRIYQYMGLPIEVTRTSQDSATVNLRCGMHEHQDFIVGLMGSDTAGWIVGRKESGYPLEGNFVEAVEHTARLLTEECLAIAQLDNFFEEA